MKVSIKKASPKGTLYAPPSKSYTHRYLIASMLSNNESVISNVYFSDDVLATLSCVVSFGRAYKKDSNSITILNENNIVKEPIFNCNESGSTLRFLIPISLTKYDHVTFKGTKKLLSRGIEVYEKLFNDKGIKIIKNKDSLVFKGVLKSGIYELDGSISSQYITGLLFALPLLDGDSVIKIIPPLNSKDYVLITLDILSKYGIEYKVDGLNIHIKGNQKYIANNFSVEGDYSNAAFLEAFNYFTGNINVKNLNVNSLQGDRIYQDYFKKLNEGNVTLDISNCIDLGPILMVFASLKHGATFTGTKRLRIKESDRANAIKDELAKVNVKVDVNDDHVIVHKCDICRQKEVFESHNDHRIVMALSLLSTLFDVTINNAQAINKSYPTYFDDLSKVGVEIEYE